MTIYDVIIIGGGPAGATAAAGLGARGRHVLLLEQSRFPREKLCGEFIAPECRPVLTRLGVIERMLEAGARPITSMTLFAPDGRGVEVPLAWLAGGAQGALGLTRARMDQILLDRARELGVEAREGVRVSSRLTRAGGVSRIEGRSAGGPTESFAARVIIDASGRNRLFAPPAARQRARLFGCKVHVRTASDLGGAGALYFFRDGYGGLSEVEGGRSNLCFMTTEETLRAARGDRARLLELTLKTNPAARQRLEGAEVAHAWLGTGPIIYGRPRPAPGVLSIGDAGAFIDPFTGSGLLLAMKSGELAAAVINRSFDEGERESAVIEARYAALHRAQFDRRLRVGALLRQLAAHPLARRLLVAWLGRHEGGARFVARSTRAARDRLVDLDWKVD